MARPAPLSPAEIEAALAAHPAWERAGDRITRRFRFADFVTAFAWMSHVALIAEKLDHHPEWRNVYATVEVELTTHDARGLTRLDFELAAAMDAFAAKVA